MDNWGLLGTIEIYSVELLDNLAILIEVPSPVDLNSGENTLNSLLLPAIVVMSAMAVLVGLLYQQRENIRQFIQKSREQDLPDSNKALPSTSTLDSPLVGVSDVSTNNWGPIRSRWDTILPDRELSVLETLFTQGSMSQQAIADQLGVSKGTMSRIISRLEDKGLLFRERFGMGNRIKLNKERL